MVTALNARKLLFLGFVWLQLGLAQHAAGQGDVYRVSVKITGGGPAVAGFLFAVNDTALVILPSRKLSRKGLTAALALSSPFSLPLSVVKKVKVTKVRSMAHDIAMGTVIGLAYSIAYLSVVPIYSPAGLIPYMVFVTGMSIITLDILYATLYKPKDPAFKIKMQKYCMQKDALVMDR